MNLLGIVLAPVLLLSAGAMDRSGSLAPAPGVDTWSPIPGPARYGHSTIYDPLRDRLIVFGSELYENDVWALSLGDSPRWTRLVTTGEGPPGRAYHTAIYDPHQDRMIVFGGLVKQMVGPGYILVPSNDVWALSLSSLTWTQLLVAGASPPPRAYHTAIYDPVRNRMLIHGGGGGEPGYADLGDVWALDLSSSPAWSQVSSDTSPPPRRLHTAIYDALRDQMVVFGGSNSTGDRNDVWSLTLATAKWTERVTSGSLPPPVLLGRVAIYDATGDRMIVDGGSDNGVWMLSLESLAWSVTTSFDGPDPRDGQTATFDPVRRRMVLFGGESTFGRDEIITLGDSWTFDVDNRSWSPLVSANRQPLMRSGQTAVYDPIRRRMLMFGGLHRSDRGYDAYMQDVWQLSLDGPMVWSPLPAAGDYPPGRTEHAAIYDPEGDRMIVFGGAEPVDCPFHPDEQCNLLVNDAWALNLGGALPTWQKLAPLGDPPSPRAGHTAVYDPLRRRMLVFGGVDSTVWALDLSDALRWSELSPSGTAPSARADHTAIYDPTGDRMVVFGGMAGRSPYVQNDTWALDLAGVGTWRLLIPGSSATPDLPTVRGGHAAVYDPTQRRMLIDGGSGPASQQDPSNDRSNTWALSLGSAPAWSQATPTASSPPPRSGHSAIFDPVGQRMVVYGGSLWAPDTWVLGLGDVPTPVLPSLVRAEVKGDGVELDWFAADAPGLAATVYRRAQDTGWQRLVALTADGIGHVRYTDLAVTRGNRYAYRLGYTEYGADRFTAEGWVELPGSSFALEGLRPDPAIGDLVASFSLPKAASARLELVDVAGRVRLACNVGALGAGRHTARLGVAGAVPAGIYWLRLTQDGRVLHARAVVLR